MFCCIMGCIRAALSASVHAWCSRLVCGANAQLADCLLRCGLSALRRRTSVVHGNALSCWAACRQMSALYLVMQLKVNCSPSRSAPSCWTSCSLPAAARRTLPRPCLSASCRSRMHRRAAAPRRWSRRCWRQECLHSRAEQLRNGCNSTGMEEKAGAAQLRGPREVRPDAAGIGPWLDLAAASVALCMAKSWCIELLTPF